MLTVYYFQITCSRLRPACPVVKDMFWETIGCWLHYQVFRSILFTVVILHSVSTQGDCYMWWRDKLAIKWPWSNYPQISLGLGLLSFLTTLFQQGLLRAVSGHKMCNQRFTKNQTGWIVLIYSSNISLEGRSNITTTLNQNFLSLS